MIDRTEKDDMWAEKARVFDKIVSRYFQYEPHIWKLAVWSLKSKVPIPQSWRYIKEGERGWFKGFVYGRR